MGKVRVAAFGVSIDGFGAGPDQGLEHPLGKRGGELMNWFYPTRAFRSMIGKDGGTEDRFAGSAMEGFGAFILGRNMFGPRMKAPKPSIAEPAKRSSVPPSLPIIDRKARVG